MAVLDASFLVNSLLVLDRRHNALVRLLAIGEPLHAPEVVDLEIFQTFRRLLRTGKASARACEEGISNLGLLRLTRHSHESLLSRIWALRDSVSAYDAAYVALAERLQTTLFTADQRLASAHGPKASVEFVG